MVIRRICEGCGERTEFVVDSIDDLNYQPILCEFCERNLGYSYKNRQKATAIVQTGQQPVHSFNHWSLYYNYNSKESKLLQKLKSFCVK